MGLDEFLSRHNIRAHQNIEYPVGFDSVFDVNLQKHTVCRIKSGFPKLFRIHFPQTLVTLDGNTAYLLLYFAIGILRLDSRLFSVNGTYLPVTILLFCRLELGFANLCIPHRFSEFVEDFIFFGVAVSIIDLAALLDLIQRRLGNVKISAFDYLGEISVEQGQKKGSDVSAVNIGISHDDYLVVAKTVDVELIRNSGPHGDNESPDFL